MWFHPLQVSTQGTRLSLPTALPLPAKDPCCSSSPKSIIRTIRQRAGISTLYISWMHNSSPLEDLYSVPCPASLFAMTNHLHVLQSIVHSCRLFYAHGHILHMHLLFTGVYAGIQEQYHPQLKVLHAVVCHMLHFKHSCICFSQALMTA